MIGIKFVFRLILQNHFLERSVGLGFSFLSIGFGGNGELGHGLGTKMADKVLDGRRCFGSGCPSTSVGIGRLVSALAGIGLPSISFMSTAKSKTFRL